MDLLFKYKIELQAAIVGDKSVSNLDYAAKETDYLMQDADNKD